jgi:hypothetical protein
MKIFFLSLILFLISSFPVTAAEFYYKTDIIIDGTWKIESIFISHQIQDIIKMEGEGKLQINSVKIVKDKIVDIRWNKLF